MKRRRNAHHLITGASISKHDEFIARRKRYVFTMIARIVLLLVAALISPHSVLGAVLVGILAAVLPGFAVVMANDGPPRATRRQQTKPFQFHDALSLAPEHPASASTIRTAHVLIDESGATLLDPR